MNWIFLFVAGLCEVGFTYCIGRAKAVAGFEFWAWWGGFLLFTVLSMILLACATRTIPIGTAMLYGLALALLARCLSAFSYLVSLSHFGDYSSLQRS